MQYLKTKLLKLKNPWTGVLLFMFGFFLALSSIKSLSEKSIFETIIGTTIGLILIFTGSILCEKFDNENPTS